MGIIKLGFKDLTRSKGKSIIVILGILIAIILISGINISTSSLTSYNFKKSLSDIYVDISIRAKSDDIDGDLKKLNKVKEYDSIIEHIIPCYSRSFYYELIITSNDSINWDKIIEDNFNTSYFQYRASIHGVNNSFYSLDRFNSTYELLSGRLPLNPREILLDYKTFSSLNLSINETITLGTYVNRPYEGLVNLTFTISNLKVVGIIKINDVEALDDFYLAMWKKNVILTNFGFAQELHENLSISNDPYNHYNFSNYVWYNFFINHNNLDLLNIEGLIERINRINNRIYIEYQVEYYTYIYGDLYWRLIQAQGYMAGVQTLLLMISIPVYFLGFFLSMTLYTVSMDKQEIKFGQYMSKGASKQQIILWIIIQAAIYGVVGGLIGFYGGYFTSYFILFSLLGNDFIPFLQEVGILIKPFTLIFSVVIGVILSLISLIKPLKDFSRKTIITTTKKFSQIKIEEKPFKSKLDWVLLIIGIIPLVFTFLFSLEIIHQLPWEIRIIALMLSYYTINLSVIAPFILLYSLIKIIGGRFSDKFFRFSRKLIKPFAKRSFDIIARNLTRNTRRTIALIFMISFTFCFAILSAVVSESQKDFETELTYLNIGSDIEARSSYGLYSPDLDKNITDMSSNINNVTPVLEFTGRTEYEYTTYYSSSSGYIELYAVKPENYLAVSQFKDKYFPIESNVNTILELNTIKNGTLVEKDWARNVGLNIGDTIKVRIYQYTDGYSSTLEMQFEIIGFFHALPGIGSSYYYYYGDNILVNYEYINETFGIENIPYNSIHYLIDIKDDVNISKTQIAQDIEENFDEYIISTRILEDELNKSQSGNPFMDAIKLLDTEYFFIIIIAIGGLIILLYENFSERNIEMAILRARGIERKELVKINSIEGIIHITYGFLFGCLGFLGAFMILKLLDELYYRYIPLAHSYIIPISMFWQIGIAIIIMIFLVWITSIIEARKTDIPNLSKLLKI